MSRFLRIINHHEAASACVHPRSPPGTSFRCVPCEDVAGLLAELQRMLGVKLRGSAELSLKGLQEPREDVAGLSGGYNLWLTGWLMVNNKG